jgi:CheY-like chemotaxis protein
MKYPLHILIVEDLKNWRKALREDLGKRFNAFQHYRQVEIDTAEDGDEALSFLKAGRKYDFVALDVNLDPDGEGSPGPSGLDVLEEIEVQNAAFFVALVTGAVTDPTLEQRYGPEAAAVMQVGLQCEAAKYFPPERIRVVNKPASGNFSDQWKSVANALGGVVEAFEYAAAWRFVFRPIKRDGKFWELRWNGGHFVRIPDKAGLAEIRYILKCVDRDDELPVAEMMARVRETLAHRRAGGARNRRKNNEEERAKKQTLVFEDVVKQLERGFREGSVNADALPQWHEFLGTNQFDKIRQAVSNHAEKQSDLRALADLMGEVIKDQKRDGQNLTTSIRLIPKTEGNQERADDQRDPDYQRMLGAFRQQRGRVKKLLNELGLGGMSKHFEEAIDCGERNPGLCPYNANVAVRWVLD